MRISIVAERLERVFSEYIVPVIVMMIRLVCWSVECVSAKRIFRSYLSAKRIFFE